MEHVERAEAEKCVKVVKNTLSKMRWHLRPHAKRRLLLDIMVLCTRLRSVILVDYGGKMPELQQKLCLFLVSSQKESSLFNSLKVMVIEDMVYLVHIKAMLEDMLWSLDSHIPLQFVILDRGSPKLVSLKDENLLYDHFASIQKLFTSLIPTVNDFKLQNNSNKMDGDGLPKNIPASTEIGKELLDFGHSMKACDIAPPVLNGWLLGYPVVYLFDSGNVTQAINNLSTRQMNLFKILICGNKNLFEEADNEEELMSFSVPIELSMVGREEPWAKEFYKQMLKKFSKHQHLWSYLKFEVTRCPLTSIIL